MTLLLISIGDMVNSITIYNQGKWKTRKAGTETETEIRKRSSDLKVSIVRRVDGNSMQVCW